MEVTCFRLPEDGYLIFKSYEIPMAESFRKDVSIMCNLSQGIKEDGIAIGKEIGKEIGEEIGEAKIIIRMHNNGFTIQQIADATDKDVKEVEDIIEGKKAVTV